MTLPKKKKCGAPKGSPGGPGRKPIDPALHRVRIFGTVKPETAIRLHVMAQQHGESIGYTIDRLVERCAKLDGTEL